MFCRVSKVSLFLRCGALVVNCMLGAAGCAKTTDGAASSATGAGKTGAEQSDTAGTGAQTTAGATTADGGTVAGTLDPNAMPPNTTGGVPVKLAPIAWPYIGFVNNPGGNDPKAVALTFDDGPDGAAPVASGKFSPSNMAHMLDQLDALQLKATFFLCGDLSSNSKTDPVAQADVQRMVRAGHHFGSHTLSHKYLVAPTARNAAFNHPAMAPAEVTAQFVQNEAAFADPKLLGPTAVPFTMYRAPYGYPFQDGIVYPPDAKSIVEDVSGVAPYTPPNAVHVGWGIDTRDWECAQTNGGTACVMKHLNAFLDRGASGPILMHSIYKLSADVLPMVVDSIKSHGYHIVMVEDMIKAKYGGTSADIARANATVKFDADTINRAATAAAMESKWYKRINED